jgi:hypothetical protein
VRLAAQDLRNALALPEDQRVSRIREAKQWLLSAADQQTSSSFEATRLFFSTPPGEVPPHESTADTLDSILADAQVANTLIAAGQALGEAGPAPDATPLDHAISSLESFESPSAEIERLNFSGEPTHSPDLPTATQTLRARTEETLRTFVSEAHSAGTTVVENLAKVDSAKALEALSQLGGPLQKLPELGELITKGMEKLKGVAESLMRLLEQAGLGAVKEKLTAFWSKLTDGTLIDSLLDWIFGKEAIDSALSKAAAATPAAFDAASDSIVPLGDSFKSKMSWAKTLTKVVAAGAGLLLLFGAVTGGPLAVFTAVTYLLILAAILMIGRNYAGDGRVFVEGPGVRAIIESLAV